MKREIDKYPNLIPNSERSPCELRELGSKGGIKSGESRRKKRDLQKSAKLWFEVFEKLEGQGVKSKDIIARLEEIYKR